MTDHKFICKQAMNYGNDKNLEEPCLHSQADSCKGKESLLLNANSSSPPAASLAGASSGTGLSPSSGTGSGKNHLQQQWERQFCSVHGNLPQLDREDLLGGENQLALEDEGSCLVCKSWS